MDRRVLGFFLASIFTATAASASMVVLSNERMTVLASAESADSVIAEVERVAAVEIQVPDSVRERSVTVAFNGLPVEKAVRKILQELEVINVAVIYRGERLRFVAFPTPTYETAPREEETEESLEGDLGDEIETADASDPAPTDEELVIAAFNR